MDLTKKISIALFCFLFLFINAPLSSSLSDQSICVNVYSFLATHKGSYNFLDIQSLDNQLGINNSEDYIINFQGKCIQYFNGALNSSFFDAYLSYNQTCSINLSPFFETPLNIGNSIYVGNYSCNTEKWLDYMIQTDNGYVTGIRFWMIFPLVIILMVGVWIIKKIKDNKI